MQKLLVAFFCVVFLFVMAWPFKLMINYVFSDYVLDLLFSGPLTYFKAWCLMLLGGGPLVGRSARK